MANGISLHFFPDSLHPGQYKLVAYADLWENGTPLRSEMFFHFVVPMENLDPSAFSNHGLALLVADAFSEIFGDEPGLVELQHINSVVAQLVEASETLTQD